MKSKCRSLLTASLPNCFAIIAIATMANTVNAADPIPGTATLSGNVIAEQPVIAAQVYAKNHDKSMLYMVYSNDGRFKTVNLMPGGYEIWAEKGRLKSEHQWMRIEAGASISVNLPMRPGPEFPLTSKDRATGGPQFGQPAAKGVELVPSGVVRIADLQARGYAYIKIE